MTEVKTFKLYDQAVLVPNDIYSPGIEYFSFKIISGSRLLLNLYVKSIDLGTTISVDVLNNFSLDTDIGWDNVLNITANGNGHFKKVLTDFNLFFQLKVTVTGGNAEFVLGASVFDNALTTRIENAEIDTHSDHRDLPGRPHDSIRIGNGAYEAKVNPNGSFDVNIVNSTNINEQVVSYFNKANAVVSGLETIIVSYTVPSLKTSKLQRVEFSGDNIGTYKLYKNGIQIGEKNVWFNGPMFGEFNFLGTTEEGPEFITGDIIELKVIHNRPNLGSFSGRIQAIEVA